MDYVQTTVLGIVQGATELLPISSSGHLLLLSGFIFNAEISTFLLTSLHLGTTLAILFAYRDLFFKGILRKENMRTLLYIGIATVPAAVIGVVFKDMIEQSLRGNLVIITMLVLVGLVMIIVERRADSTKPSITKWEDIKWWQSLLIGFGQSLALIPGTSRSGASTVVGILLGIEKFKALEYSFILGVPIMLGSFLYEMVSVENSLQLIARPQTILGILISAVVGYLAIIALRRFAKTRFLTFFGFYRIILGILLLIAIK